jgi:hypothetical protein
MASSSSVTTNNLALVQPTEKLSKINHTIWYAQVNAALCGAKLMGYLIGEAKPPPTEIPKIGAGGKEIKTADRKVVLVPNPEHEDWMRWISRF